MGLWLRSNEINIKCREILCEAIFNWDSAVWVKACQALDEDWNGFLFPPPRLDYGRSPHAYVNQRLQIQLELLMMSGMPLETCWAFNEPWNNKFYCKVASCWLFLLGFYIWLWTDVWLLAWPLYLRCKCNHFSWFPNNLVYICSSQ
jgi:hypothetical protein